MCMLYPQLVARGVKMPMGVAELSPVHGKQEAGGSSTKLLKPCSPQISMTSALKEVGAVSCVFEMAEE